MTRKIVLSADAIDALNSLQDRLQGALKRCIFCFNEKKARQVLISVGGQRFLDVVLATAQFHGRPLVTLVKDMSLNRNIHTLAQLANNIRKPVWMAESANPAELPQGLVHRIVSGTMSIVTGVSAHAKGLRGRPANHDDNRRDVSHNIDLAFVSGLCLANGPDRNWIERIAADKQSESIKNMLKGRLLAALKGVLSTCPAGETRCLIIPGIGAGFFAGAYAGTVKAALADAVKETIGSLVDEERAKISGVILDFFRHDVDETIEISGVPVKIYGSEGQLVPIPTKEEFNEQLGSPMNEQKLASAKIVKVVAWDMLSFETNEGLLPCGFTSDDGITGVCTDVIDIVYESKDIMGSYAKRRIDPVENNFMPGFAPDCGVFCLGEDSELQIPGVVLSNALDDINSIASELPNASSTSMEPYSFAGSACAISLLKSMRRPASVTSMGSSAYSRCVTLCTARDVDIISRDLYSRGSSTATARTIGESEMVTPADVDSANAGAASSSSLCRNAMFQASIDDTDQAALLGGVHRSSYQAV